MDNVIICLSRGYGDNLRRYQNLLLRNKSIFERINKKVNNKYPLIIFHEGNITSNAKKHIIKNGFGQLISFKNVENIWIKNFPGYISMCRFYSYYVWGYCREFDNILRIDDDCIIRSFEDDPFVRLNDFVFLKSASWEEQHEKTNSTLPNFIEELTGKKKEDFYIHNFPYTNVMVSNVKFWLDNNINEVLKEIALSNDAIDNRWGDLPILGSLLNIYAKDKVDYIKNLSYQHLSHKNDIKT